LACRRAAAAEALYGKLGGAGWLFPATFEELAEMKALAQLAGYWCRETEEERIMNRKAISSGILKASLAMTAVLLVLFFSAQPLRAQVDTGTILGTVGDASGAAISGAKVTLTNEGTSAALSTVSGSDGGYKFTPIKIGSYKVTVTFQGFQTLTQTNIVVNVGADVVINFALKPGAVTETVEVTSNTPVLETQNGSVGQVVDTRSVNDLPLNGRNFTFLAQLSAGVNTPQADTRGNAASGAFAANGNRPAQNNYLLDGIDNNSDTVDFLNGTNFVVLPPVDAIDEFKVQTTGFSAEFGRSGAAVLNATIKSGTNELHGAAWEFFRNDKLDAADYFENAGGTPKGELRQNQFGFSAGGPVVIPHLFDGRNKVFFFGDYEGLRRIQGTVLTGSVPTAAERSSGFTNLSDLITFQSGTQKDALGRTMPTWTILDPTTTRQTSPGVFVRDPFGSCVNEPANFVYTVAACGLNQIPAGRLDQNAITLLKLYPAPNGPGVSSNFTNSPKLDEHRNAFDSRIDINFSQKDTLFFRFSLVDDPQLIPGIFGGVADGGGFQQGTQTAIAQQSALGYTHTFSPTLVNVARAGLNYLHTSRYSPEASNLTDIPSTYGILGVSQQSLNGGLPAFGINGLSTLGSNAFLPSNEVTSTIQLTDDVTKIYGKHTFKMGIEYQHVKFSTLQPPWSRGEFDFNGNYTDIPNNSNSNTGIANFLLVPAAAANGGTVGFLGGPTQIYLSNISLTDNGKNYYGVYGNDDIKVNRKLTVNVGLRYDFFGLVFEHHSNQANFIPSGGPFGQATYLMPGGKDSCNNTFVSISFTTLLAQDNIKCAATNAYGGGLGNSQKANFAPRVGFAYQVSPKLVVRGGFGIFFNGFENRGFSPNIGENYPFQFNFSYGDNSHGTATIPSQIPTNYVGCPATAATGNTPTFESGFSCNPLSPLQVLASGLSLRGIQFNYKTPYSMSGNLTLQYQITPTMSVQAGYVTSLGRHLEVFPSSNNITQILPANLPAGETTSQFLPFQDFSRGASYAATEGDSVYHGLQTKVEKQFRGGLNFLATYTWSKTLSDAGDLLNGGSLAGYRAPSVPGVGIQYDYGLANFDIRNVFHFSGGYQLPFGKGKKFMSGASGFAEKAVGGWSIQWITTLQGGQPITLSCPNGTTNTLGCYDLLVSGQPLDLGLHTDAHGKLSWFGNPNAFTQPPKCTQTAIGAPLVNCGISALGGGPAQVPGPGFHRLDFSVFKDVPLNERMRLQFRTEIFNLTNHPNFNAPGFGGNGVVSISGSTNFNDTTHFGEIGSTRDAPYDSRQIQFALKFYY
jgi:carboxypeptidase family protein/TonB-dependent receptor-like protein